MKHYQVYFVATEPFDGRIKVGMSGNVADRIDYLQCGNASMLRVLHTIDRANRTDAYSLEHTIHTRLHDIRGIGEWFNMSIERATEVYTEYAAMPYEPSASDNATDSLATEIFRDHPVRVLGTFEEPLFVANDIGIILGIKQISASITDFDDTQRTTGTVQTAAGPRQAILLTESGLYTVLCISRKPAAKIFKTWVCSVLIKIRKTGRYDMLEDSLQHQGVVRQLRDANTALAKLQGVRSEIATPNELRLKELENENIKLRIELMTLELNRVKIRRNSVP